MAFAKRTEPLKDIRTRTGGCRSTHGGVSSDNFVVCELETDGEPTP